MSVRFVERQCDQNPWCPVTKICPTGAMSIDERTGRPAFDESKCSGCEICVTSCPRGAIVAE